MNALVYVKIRDVKVLLFNEKLNIYFTKNENFEILNT